ncbi:zf-BED domain-containing protein, partial [Cephalotus follicularis]
DSKNVYNCMYCENSYKGGGIHRMKYHLTGIRGQIGSCKKVPRDIRVMMQELIASMRKDKKKESNDYDMGDGDDEYENEEDVQEIPHPSVDVKGKRKASGTLDKYLTPRTTSNDPSLKSVFTSKEAIWRAKMDVAHWVYNACIPFNALQSPYFQPAIDAMVIIGRGFKGPSYHEIRVGLLKDCKKEC